MRKRRPSRWFVVVCLFLCVFGFLLLLTALIDAPADAAVPAPQSHTVADLALVTAALPMQETGSPSLGAMGTYLSLAFLLCLLTVLPPLVKGSDANGRVLRKKRYVCSFYPVFKQELACG